MPSTFYGIYVGSSGLIAAQVGENVVGNNIANANTPGYSAETTNFTESTPYTPIDGNTILHPGMIGTGVTASSITRATDAFTTTQLRDAYSQQSFNSTTQNTLNQVQAAFNEPSTSGLSNAMSKFFQGFNDLVNNPQDSGVRAGVIQNGVALTQVFHNMGQQLSDINNGVSTQINTDMTMLNSYGAQIGKLNVQIKQSLAEGQQPNALMDQRDVLIDKVSKLANVDVVTQPNGMVNVAIGSTDLVVGPDAYNVTLSGLQSRNDLQSGTLAGIVSSQATTLAFQSKLNTLASAVVSAVNSVQQQGSDMYGNTGSGGSNPAQPFFTMTGTPTATILVNPALISDPKLLAAAAAGVPGTPPPPGDGSNAAAFVAISNQTLGGLGQTAMSFYQSMISNVGTQASAATTAVNNANATVTQLTQQKESTTGVSTDAEMVDMLKYQQAYAASAKFVQTANSMLSTLISGLFGG